jgi:hypothetical protein
LETTRRLSDEELLYRKVDVGQWDDEGLLPDAFIDHYERQSFYVASYRTPEAVLEAFASMKGINRRFQADALDARKLFDLGFRIATVPVKDVRDLGCMVEADDLGNEFTQSGHVNLRGARDFAEELAIIARLLTREETFLTVQIARLDVGDLD